MTGRQRPCRVKLKRETAWEYLNRKNIAQNELARRADISTGYLSQLIGGTRSPSPELRETLQDLLGVDFEDLFNCEWNDT